MRSWIKTMALATALALLIGALPVSAATPGDVNADGAADYSDAVYLLSYILLPEESPLAQAPDYTGDGVVDDDDALYLLYYTLLPGQYPLSADVTLPQVGYDPDGKGRIQLTTIAREGGTVTVVFTNNSKTWVTEETSYITYICTAADGTALETGTLHLGYLKCGSTVTGQITLPTGTATLAFTGGDIPYWSAWKQ